MAKSSLLFSQKKLHSNVQLVLNTPLTRTHLSLGSDKATDRKNPGIKAEPVSSAYNLAG